MTSKSLQNFRGRVRVCHAGYPNWAQRYAVLYPLLTGSRTFAQARKGSPSKHLASPVLTLLHWRLERLWQTRLIQLHKAGWNKLPTLKDVYFHNRCVPFGLSLVDGTQLRYCNRGNICPNCYARWVLRTYRRVASVPEFLNGPLEIVRWSRSRSVRLDDPSQIASLRSWLSSQRSSEVLLTRPAGAIVRYAIEPWPGFWRVHKQLLFLVSPTTPDPPRSDPNDRYERSPYTTRRELSRFVGYAFRYPRGLMFGDVSETVRILEHFHGFAHTSSYGLLRQTKQ